MKSAVSMRSLTRCEGCGALIWATNVFKTVVIPGAVGHLALVFRCPSCEKVGKAAVSLEDWNTAQDKADIHDSRIEQIMTGAHIDVESVTGVDDLLAEWSVGPVIREEIMNLCKCSTCKARLYSET